LDLFWQARNQVGRTASKNEADRRIGAVDKKNMTKIVVCGLCPAQVASTWMVPLRSGHIAHVLAGHVGTQKMAPILRHG